MKMQCQLCGSTRDIGRLQLQIGSEPSNPVPVTGVVAILGGDFSGWSLAWDTTKPNPAATCPACVAKMAPPPAGG